MHWFWKIPIIGPLVFSVWKLDAQRKYDWLAPFLDPSDKLLEIGSGPGSTVDIFQEAGHTITPLDITDTSFKTALRPVLYDGERLPFDDNSFDVALLLTTLHHTSDPEKIIREAKRVAIRVIIIEDIYTSPLQRRLTKIADSITNLEFWGHPHSNHDDREWCDMFKALGFSIHHTSQKPMAGYFLQSLYVLDDIDSTPDQMQIKQFA